MGAELSVMFGLAIVAVMFSYYSYSFKDHPETIMRQVSIFFFFMSLLFINMILYSCLLIAQNNSLSYLETGVINAALTVVTYLTTGAVILYFIILFVMAVIGLSGSAMSWVKGRGKNDEP